MRLVSLETLRPVQQPNLCFVRLSADDGNTGLGESFFGAQAVEAYLHESVAPVLLGLDDPTPVRVARLLQPYVGQLGSGVETRGNGAVDIALWDLIGHQTNRSLAQMLGGPIRDQAPIYNTCAGVRYVSHSIRQESANWGLPTGAADGRYEDLDAFLRRPAKLARDLFDEGIRGMKIWPFDRGAERTGGLDISKEDLASGLTIIEAIRSEVGFDMDVMVEMHGLWSRIGATKIASALTEYRPFWIEDPIRSGSMSALSALRSDIDVPIATGETSTGRRAFLPLLQAGAIDIATLDVGWTGGITEAVKVASLADTYEVPIAPHDCTGPVSLAVAVHFVCSEPNGLIQETVRAFLRSWYSDFVEGLPAVEGGIVRLPVTPGHGISLRGDLEARDLVLTRRSEP